MTPSVIHFWNPCLKTQILTYIKGGFEKNFFGPSHWIWETQNWHSMQAFWEFLKFFFGFFLVLVIHNWEKKVGLIWELWCNSEHPNIHVHYDKWVTWHHQPTSELQKSSLASIRFLYKKDSVIFSIFIFN